ncbi:MAG: hypothetical protein AAFY47_12180 [Pseudomonadota bacterium]
MFNPLLLETKSADAPLSPDRATSPQRVARYRPRRSTEDRLREALETLAEGRAVIMTHEETAWSSITFTGTRHEVVLDFDGRKAVEVAEEFIETLAEHEFRIPGQLVADASVREVDHRFGADERMIVTCVLLLLEDA